MCSYNNAPLLAGNETGARMARIGDAMLDHGRSRGMRGDVIGFDTLTRR